MSDQMQPGGDVATRTAEEQLEQRTRLHGLWSAVAPSWGAYADETDIRSAAETEVLLARSDPRLGDRVLEMACGAAGLGIAAARLVSPGGSVVVSDVSPEMVEIADARVRAARLSNVTSRILDLESIDEPDASFDGVVCRHGMQFTLDPAAAAREVTRVLRPGGRLAFSVWAEPVSNPWLTMVLKSVAAELGHEVPPTGMPGPFALCTEELVKTAFAGSGLAHLRFDEISVPSRAASFEDWWTMTCALTGPLSSILAQLDEQSATSIRERARTAAETYRTSAGGYEYPGLARIVSGRMA